MKSPADFDVARFILELAQDMPAPDSPPLAEKVAEAVPKGAGTVAEALRDSDVGRWAADELAGWGCPRPVARLFVFFLARYMAAQSGRLAGWTGSFVLEQAGKIVGKLPGAGWLGANKERIRTLLSEKARAQAELREILDGRRPARGAELAQSLALDLRTQIEMLARQEEQAAALSGGLAELRGQYDAILAALKPEPLLYQDEFLADRSGINRFHYRMAGVPFYGREAELAELEFFLDDPRKRVSWWLVTSGGGAGKSRLAAELCRRVGSVWRTGFLPRPLVADEFRNWEPQEPTLIVVDYVVERPVAVGDLIRQVAARLERSGEAAAVRFLLLERQADKTWLNAFRGASGTGDVSRTRALGFRPDEPLVLGAFPDDALWKLGCFWMDALLLSPDLRPSREDFLTRLAEIDDQKRPLFAALLADTLANGRGVATQWDAETLVRDFLEREKATRWEPARVTEAEKDMLTLATMAGGLSPENRPELEDEALAASFKELTERLDPSLYSLVSGRPTDNGLAKLEPDLIGELYVLEYLRPPANPLLQASAKDWLRRAAFYCGDGNAAAHFVLRAHRDFPSHTTMKHLVTPERGVVASYYSWAIVEAGEERSPARLLAEQNSWISADPAARQALAEWLSVEIITLSELSERTEGGDNSERPSAEASNLSVVLADEVMQRYRRLRDLAAAHAGEPALREEQARSARNRIIHCAATRPDEALALYGEVKALAEFHPGDPTLREQQAYSAVNLINRAAAARSDEALALYDEVKALAEAHPGEPALREAQGKSASDWIGHCAAARPSQARDLHDQVKALAAAHPGEPDLRERQADSATNWIHGCAAARPDEALVLYGEVKALADAHPGEPVLRERQAYSAVNLINRGAAARPEEALALYEEVKALAAAHPGEPALREAQAKSATNWILRAAAARPDQARDLYDELKALTEAHPGEPALREAQAMSADRWIHDCAATRPAEALALYSELKELADAHPREPGLRERQAQSLVGLALRAATCGDRVRFGQALQELRSVVEAHSNDPQVAKVWEQFVELVNRVAGSAESGW